MTREDLLRSLLVERYLPVPHGGVGGCDDGPTRQWALHEAALELAPVELVAVA